MAEDFSTTYLGEDIELHEHPGDNWELEDKRQAVHVRMSGFTMSALVTFVKAIREAREE